MTYIELINRFWQVHEQQNFSGNEGMLYFYLLKVANASIPAWPREFEQADPKTAVNSNLSLNTMKKCRIRLQQVGLIGFEEGGKGRGDKVRYQIRYQKLTPCLGENEPERCQESRQNLTPKQEKVSGKVSVKLSKSDTNTIYKRLKTKTSLTEERERKKIEVFRLAKKRQRKAPLVPRVPPKPFVPIRPLYGDPFRLKSDSERVNIPFTLWYNLYQYNVNETGARRLWLDLTNSERQKVMEHTPPYVKSTPNKRFRKTPVNYLEDKTFNDEIIDRHGNDKDYSSKNAVPINPFGQGASIPAATTVRKHGFGQRHKPGDGDTSEKRAG